MPSRTRPAASRAEDPHGEWPKGARLQPKPSIYRSKSGRLITVEGAQRSMESNTFSGHRRQPGHRRGARRTARERPAIRSSSPAATTRAASTQVAAETGAHGLRADVASADDNARTVDACRPSAWAASTCSSTTPATPTAARSARSTSTRCGRCSTPTSSASSTSPTASCR